MRSIESNSNPPIKSEPNRDDFFDTAVEIAQKLQDKGYESYFVGGWVRDVLLGVPSHDIDIATNAPPDIVTGLFPDSAAVRPREAYGVTYVKKGDYNYEIATFREDIGSDGRRPQAIALTDLEKDLMRRDFTVNALAYDPISSQLIDVAGGLDDIDDGIIRFVGEAAGRIGEDRLRILRAIRFKNRLGFQYDTATATSIRQAIKSGLLGDIAFERIYDECSRMLTHPSRADAVRDMHGLGVIEQILPEVDACVGIEQPKKYHLEGDVFTHTLLTLENLPENCSVPLVWAGLLHDIGKPITLSRNNDGEIHFNGHAEAGSHIAAAVLRRMRMPKKRIDDTLWLIGHHMLFADWSSMRQATKLKYLQNPLFDDLIVLMTADHNASHFEDDKLKQADYGAIKSAVADRQHFTAEAKVNPRPTLKDIGIDGQYLIDNYDLKPGPEIGDLLNKLNDALLEDQIHTADDAVALVEKWLQ